MTGIDLEAGTLNRPAGIIAVDGQDTTTALVVTYMVALLPPATQSCVSSILWHNRVRDDERIVEFPTSADDLVPV